MVPWAPQLIICRRDNDLPLAETYGLASVVPSPTATPPGLADLRFAGNLCRDRSVLAKLLLHNAFPTTFQASFRLVHVSCHLVSNGCGNGVNTTVYMFCFIFIKFHAEYTTTKPLQV